MPISPVRPYRESGLQGHDASIGDTYGACEGVRGWMSKVLPTPNRVVHEAVQRPEQPYVSIVSRIFTLSECFGISELGVPVSRIDITLLC